MTSLPTSPKALQEVSSSGTWMSHKTALVRLLNVYSRRKMFKCKCLLIYIAPYLHSNIIINIVMHNGSHYKHSI